MISSLAKLILTAAIGLTAHAVAARPPATARLVACDAGDCLLVRGHRVTPKARVLINGREVATHGGRAWTVELPVATVRDWSALYARAIQVVVGDAETPEMVRLPVGMLGHDVALASLVVRAR